MNVASVSGTTSPYASGSGEASGHAARRKAFDAAANALGMSTQDLRSALRNGQTMSSLAQSKGVSADSLTSAISTALTGADSSLSSGKAQEIAAHMVAGPSAGAAGGAEGAGGARHGHHHHSDGDAAQMDTAGRIGLSAASLGTAPASVSQSAVQSLYQQSASQSASVLSFA